MDAPVRLTLQRYCLCSPDNLAIPNQMRIRGAAVREPPVVITHDRWCTVQSIAQGLRVTGVQATGFAFGLIWLPSASGKPAKEHRVV